MKQKSHAELSAEFPGVLIMDVNMSGFDGKVGKFLGVSQNGVFTTNPFLSKCGRFDVDPVETYGIPEELAKQILTSSHP